MKIIKSIIILTVFFQSMNSFSQQVLSTASNNATGIGGSFCYNIGQLTYSTYYSTSGSISEGIAQLYENSISTCLESFESDFTIYYTSENIGQININEEILRYWLFDLNGRLLELKNIDNKRKIIDIGRFHNNILILKFETNNKILYTYKIIKK